MKRLIVGIAAAATLAAAPAWSALRVGAPAPTFTVQATLGGEVHPFSLSEKLRSGPVVLYFFPSAFTQGCTIEAHEFADHMDEFAAAGASVIGMTAGQTERLAEFSRSECRSRFPVAAATPDLIRQYDAAFAVRPNLSDRVTYVIDPQGRIIWAHVSTIDPRSHVNGALQAVRTWRAAHPARR
jgi:peroxiredoxin